MSINILFNYYSFDINNVYFQNNFTSLLSPSNIRHLSSHLFKIRLFLSASIDAGFHSQAITCLALA